MKYLTRADFDAIAAKDSYYKIERWHLYEAAMAVIQGIGPSTVLELGPYRLPIVVESDTMDRRANLEPTIVHDACVTPWPINRHYDVFIALQVWEHLSNPQQAFQEVRSLASHAVLSFPYLWNCPKNPSHHGITKETIREWTHGLEPQSIQIVPSQSNHRRILYHFILSQ